ncbi:phosphatidate cytidylyltransferase [Candidatus Laterigemmans baculatus]|uniref:phosphatidate cytidylyltransferase n=1 Tax=Candidatus Laterigemmans baculatus TaxID=2770505 RepID=UPI0013D9DCC8|nr:phosphatidate cytidylyltransferase [Candidatus Laterigemmans baculatus]
MLRDRLISSAVLLAIVAVCLWLDANYPPRGVGGVWLLPLLVFFAGGTSTELSRLLVHAGRLVRTPVAVAGALLVTLAATIPSAWGLAGEVYPPDCPVGRLGWIVIGGIAAVGIVFAAEMSTYGRGPTGAIERLASGGFIALYVGLPLAMLVALRGLGSTSAWGLAALVTMVAATKSADAGAYFTGRSLGRHKLIPRLSPGKTWEGAIGGIVFAILVSYGCIIWLFPALTGFPTGAPWWGPIVLGVACALAGMFGDLAESLIKRDSGAKDSGGLLPGLGGVWDVTDSLIGASLPAYLCFVAGVAGPVA